MEERRKYLNVPFAEKEQAKELGAKWDKGSKRWYIPEKLGSGDAEKLFKKWHYHAPSLHDIEDQFRAALVAAGLVIDGMPEMDGQWHRTTVVTSHKTKALKGSYIGYIDGAVPNGYIKNFDTGYGEPWFFVKGQHWQRHQETEDLAAAKAERERQLIATQERVAERCTKIWESLSDTENHPYLGRKGVDAFGLRAQGDNLVTPVRDVGGKIWSLQYISAKPGRIKLYEKGGRKTGNFHVLGNLTGARTVLFAEGYATCASLHMATRLPVVEVFDSGNIDAVLQTLGPTLQGIEKIICADDDTATEHKVKKVLNNEKTLERFGLAGIDMGEIETALASCEAATLQAKGVMFLPVCLIAAIIFLAFLFVAAQLLVTLIESYIAIGGGVILLGFGGSRWTTDFATKYLQYAVGTGLKLMILYLIVGTGQTIMNSITLSSSYFLESLFAAMGSAFLYAYLAIQVPQIASSMMSGSPSLTAGSLAGTALTMGAAMAGAGAATASVASSAGSAAVGGVSGAAGFAQAVSAGLDAAHDLGKTGMDAGMYAGGEIAKQSIGLMKQLPDGFVEKTNSSFGGRVASGINAARGSEGAQGSPASDLGDASGASVSGGQSPPGAPSGDSGGNTKSLQEKIQSLQGYVPQDAAQGAAIGIDMKHTAD